MVGMVPIPDSESRCSCDVGSGEEGHAHRPGPLSRENIKRLKGGQANPRHGANRMAWRCRRASSLVIFTGETEASMEADLRKLA